MPDFPVYKPKKVIKALEKAGFIRVRTRGSHIQMKKANCLVTVPMHNRDLNKSTFKSILRQARMTADEFQGYL
ncbi:MAG TPA: addiction module toxin, HicA family [bacterium]|nr:addiction module toxin, HicA family [bacterium]